MLGRFAKVPSGIETTDVVNELVVRLINVLQQKTFDTPAQFLRYAALTIRSNLIDLASRNAGALWFSHWADRLQVMGSWPGAVWQRAK